MTLTEAHVPWAAATMLIRQHGEGAGNVAAKRIEELGASGDKDGVTMWTKIKDCIDRLIVADRIN